jgi:hypothetical protein
MVANGGKWWQIMANNDKIIANREQNGGKWWEMVANDGEMLENVLMRFGYVKQWQLESQIMVVTGMYVDLES